MKKLAILISLALLAFPGCSTSEPTGDYSPGTQPEDLEMEATGDTSYLDPYKNEEPTGDHDIGTQPEDLEMEATGDTSYLDPYKKD